MQIDWIVWIICLSLLFIIPWLKPGEWSRQTKETQNLYVRVLVSFIICTILMIVDAYIWDLYP